ncbi:hypothetical protein EUTSA_v10005264mg [Eutrema salsugineum]|uniref:RIN4 pathogenic type III effector avirulence factor Avr cleavage site domain-containing protein n=1 Tax=Eutrema salsugineum TaxID=72664 RepID=V4KJJ2_EUTSA|nr:hypothetical protein EUTSA_v10005264mg [Eutrema salsugineum]
MKAKLTWIKRVRFAKNGIIISSYGGSEREIKVIEKWRYVWQNKNAPWLSVPQFGDWDQKGGTIPDYSMDFSKIREMRKQNKRDPSRASLGNEEDLINPFHNQPTSSDTTKAKLTTVHSDNNNNSNHNGFSHHHPHSPSKLTEIIIVIDFGDETFLILLVNDLEQTRRGIFSCFNCCVKA